MTELLLDFLDSRECEFVCVLIAAWILAVASTVCLPEKQLRAKESEVEGD